MKINGLGTDVANIYKNAMSSQADDVSFKKTLDKATANTDDEKLKEVCQEFEAYYIRTLFTQMRKTIPKSELFEESSARKIYEDMQYDEYAKEISSGRGIGIADSLYQQLSRSNTQGK